MPRVKSTRSCHRLLCVTFLQALFCSELPVEMKQQIQEWSSENNNIPQTSESVLHSNAVVVLSKVTPGFMKNARKSDKDIT